MGQMNHQEFAKRFLAAMHAGDRERMGAMMHPDFLIEEAASLPYAGQYRGLEGWLALCKAVIATWKSFSLDFIEFAGESDDGLVIRFRLRGVSRKTGRPIDSSVLEFWTFRDGKLVSIAPYYFDTHALVVANTS